MPGTVSIRVEALEAFPKSSRKLSESAWTESSESASDEESQVDFQIQAKTKGYFNEKGKASVSASAVSMTSEPPLAKAVPLLGFLMLICSFCTISSLGVAFDLLAGVSPVLKLFWKVSGTCIVTTALCIPKIPALLRGSIAIPRIQELLACAVGYCIWNCTFIYALDHTSVAHAYILNNSHSLVLVVYKLLCRRPVAKLETIGTIVGIAGGILTASDHSASRSKAVGPSITGDCVAFLGAIGAAVYLTNAKTIRSKKDMSFMVFMWLHMCTVCAVLSVVLFFLGDQVTLSRDPTTGLFGWLDTSRLPLEIYLVAVCDFVGGMGYIRVLKYFEPIVVSIVMLLEPILAVLLGIAVGVSNVPGIVTVFGSLVVIAGTGMVIWVSTRPRQIEDTDYPRRTTMYGSIAAPTMVA